MKRNIDYVRLCCLFFVATFESFKDLVGPPQGGTEEFCYDLGLTSGKMIAKELEVLPTAKQAERKDEPRITPVDQPQQRQEPEAKTAQQEQPKPFTPPTPIFS